MTIPVFPPSGIRLLEPPFSSLFVGQNVHVRIVVSPRVAASATHHEQVMALLTGDVPLASAEDLEGEVHGTWMESQVDRRAQILNFLARRVQALRFVIARDAAHILLPECR